MAREQVSRTPAAERCRFGCQGKLQTLDHALVTSGPQSAVRSLRYARVNDDAHSSVAGHHVCDHDPPLLTIAQ